MQNNQVSLNLATNMANLIGSCNLTIANLQVENKKLKEENQKLKDTISKLREGDKDVTGSNNSSN